MKVIQCIYWLCLLLFDSIIFIFPVGLDATVLKRNRALTEDFTKLYLELDREGYFKPSYLQAFLRMAELFVLAAIGYVLLQSQNFTVSSIGIVFLGFAQGRCAYLTHELGHYSYTGNPKIDRILHSITDGKY